MPRAAILLGAGRTSTGIPPHYAQSFLIPVATQLIISNRSACRLETHLTPILTTKVLVLIDTNVGTPNAPATPPHVAECETIFTNASGLPSGHPSLQTRFASPNATRAHGVLVDLPIA